MKSMKKPARREANTEVAFGAESVGLNGLLPAGVLSPDLYRSQWCPRDLKGKFEKVRSLKDSLFVGGLNSVRLAYFADGFRVVGEAVRAWLEERKLLEAVERLHADVWDEWLLMDNAVVFWRESQDGAPKLVVFDCEIVNYTNRFGIEVLKVKPGRQVLSDPEKVAVGDLWAKAYEQGKEIDITNDGSFHVLTRAKLGKGLCAPRVAQLLDTTTPVLSTIDLLMQADYSGAWRHRDVIRHIKGGHPIESGPHSGKNTYHLKAKQKTAIQKEMKARTGAFDVVSNFDVDLGYSYLDPKFFDDIKYKGVYAQYRAWAGAPAFALETGKVDPVHMDAFGKEGKASRKLVAGLLEKVCNDPRFLGDAKPPGPIRFAWNPHSFRDFKLMLEWVRMTVGQGLASPQTGREVVELDDQVEGDRLVEAAEKRERYTPVFEPKQGMLTDRSERGGRPGENDLPEE